MNHIYKKQLIFNHLNKFHRNCNFVQFHIYGGCLKSLWPDKEMALESPRRRCNFIFPSLLLILVPHATLQSVKYFVFDSSKLVSLVFYNNKNYSDDRMFAIYVNYILQSRYIPRQNMKSNNIMFHCNYTKDSRKLKMELSKANFMLCSPKIYGQCKIMGMAVDYPLTAY